MRDEPQDPSRAPADAHRLEALGFSLAKQGITRDARTRERRDRGFRADMVPMRELLRPHVFLGSQARDAACRSPMPGGVLALEPVSAGELRFRSSSECLFALGHGIDHPHFEEVASAVADSEIANLLGRTSRDRDGTRHSRSIVLTVTGAHYQLLIDGVGRPEVRAKAPFDVVPDLEVTRTATWFMMRLMEGLDGGTESQAVH